MLFPEEDTPHLKKWIVKRIENTFVTVLLKLQPRTPAEKIH